MDKNSEINAVVSQWKTLDDSSIIRDVLFKGKFIANALNFIKERNGISLEDAKLIFFEVTHQIVKILVQNKQLHRANHVLKNAQLNETHYFYDMAQESDESVKKFIMEFLKTSSTDKEVEDEKILKANHTCFKLLTSNISKHLKYLDNVNSMQNNFVITPQNIQNANIIFGTFMKQSLKWRNEIAVDVFFKSKRDPDNLYLLPILEKETFFSYIIQNELYGLLKKWLNEQYLSRAGKAIQSTISEPDTFDEALNYIFREWKFEPSMMERISRREKDVIKNDFAKLGLFESREAKSVCRKLNRLFTTHTFDENYSLAVKSEEITKFIIENKLIDLLNEKFIDHNYISGILESNTQLLRDELTLLEAVRNLLSNETSLEDFVRIMKITTLYIQKFDKSFDDKRTDLVLIENMTENNLQNFRQLSENNLFLRNFHHKLSDFEELPSIEDLLEKFHSIKLDFIRDEFSQESLPSFDDPQMSSSYGENFSLSYLHYIQQNQGIYATYVFIMEMIKNSMTISKPQVMSGCEEVAKLALQDPLNEKLVAHVVAFNECFNVDTKNLRCLLQLLKIKRSESKGFEKFLNSTISASSSEEDLKKVEALEMFWNVKKFQTPSRGYLETFLETDDWFRFILLAQYFNYPLESFISICEERLKNKTLCDNLIRAVSYNMPELNRHASFTQRRRSKESEQESGELFKGAKFLDSKHDLFAILLKCNESISRIELPFEEFQKFFLRDLDEVDDLLFQARKYDWPIIAVLAGTTTVYRIKYCFLTWLILSSDFKYTRKYENIEELAKSVFEHCLTVGFIRTLNESSQIFYPETALEVFTKFLLHTKNGNFDDMESLLKLFIVKLSENDYKMKVIKGKEQLLPFIFRCLILHLQHNIRFGSQQEQYLECLHKSEVSQFVRKIDFGLLKQISKILEQTNVRINYMAFCEQGKKSTNEIERILDELINFDHFKEAIQITELMQMSKNDFVFKLWRRMYEKEDQKQTSFDIQKYIGYVESFNLNMDIFIKFLMFIVDGMVDCVEKYNIMKFILKNSKASDSLEYDVIHLYIRLKCESSNSLEPLTSSYYQEVIKKEKCLIHVSLYDLKAIAKIDELSISYKSLTDKSELAELEKLIHELLDLNDMVQVLRIQEMFGYAPEDLKILVYMLSVCEGLTSIYDISKQERQTISSYGQMSNKFNRFTLRSLKNNSMSMSSSFASMDLNESLVLNESSRYQENKETFQALQGLVSKIKQGVKYGQRIVLIYRASLYLNRSFKFNELMQIKNPFEFLEHAASCDNENKLLVMSDIIDAMGMTEIEVAEFISKEIVACIIRTRFLQFTKETEVMSSSMTSSSCSPSTLLDEIWGFSLSKDIHLIFELCKGKTSLLANYLLKYYKIMSQAVTDIPIHSEDQELERLCEHLNKTMNAQIMSQKKQNIIRVEILIVAHDCFCQECSTEGIATILNLTKNLVNTLAKKKSFNLIVRLLCGIGRFREMFYAFDILIKNEVFEALLGQFSDKQANGLKNAILSYLNENHPNNREYYKMAAAHFSMYTELANHSKASAIEKLNKVIGENQVKRLKSGRISTNQIQQVEIPYLKCNKSAITNLQEALNEMKHTTEMLSIDNKIEMSLKFCALCELVAMQIHLIKLNEESEEKLCPCVINFEQHAEKFQYFANYELSIPQTMILNKNIEGSIDYSKSIFVRSIINGDEAYLLDYMGRFNLTDGMIENLVKLAQLESIEKKQEKVLHDLVMMVRNCDLKFKLASLLGLKGILQKMLNDEQSYYYLLDSKYGNVDIF